MRFFFDNNLAPKLARAIGALAQGEDYAVAHLRERYDASTPDVTWIEALASEGDWVIVSGDRRITRTPHEREAWRRSGLTAFFLAKGWSSLTLWDQAWRLVHWWPRIVEQASLVKPGAGFIVPVRGKLEQLRV